MMTRVLHFCHSQPLDYALMTGKLTPSSHEPPNLRSGVIFFLASLLLWLEREKSNAWYIHLTSHQPPPNLHNLTSAWPVTLLANKRLPYRNQILARIMSLLKSVLGEKNFLNTSVFRWRFVKKKINNVLFLWWNTASWSCRTFVNSYK